jgi:L-rhamnose isomerase
MLLGVLHRTLLTSSFAAMILYHPSLIKETSQRPGRSWDSSHLHLCHDGSLSCNSFFFRRSAFVQQRYGIMIQIIGAVNILLALAYISGHESTCRNSAQNVEVQL